MRLSGLFLAIQLHLALAAIAQQPNPAATGTGADWPDFLGTNRDSKSPETNLRTNWSGEPPVVWQCRLGTGYAAPSISRSRLFHYDRYGDVARLNCRESTTGRELWKYEHSTDYEDLLGYNNGPRCSPVIDGERVYVFSAEGHLHCVKFADGKPIWQLDTSKQFGVVKNFFGVGSTPVVFGDLLIANIGGSPAGSPTDVYAAQGKVEGSGSGLVAFDKRTGEVRWQATDELASYSSPVVTMIDSRPWGFCLARGGLIGFDPRSGIVDFQFPWRARMLESVNASGPVVVGNRVFISECYAVGSALLAVAPGKVEVVWQDGRRRDKSLELHWNTAVHHKGFLYGSSGRHSGQAELRCVEMATGEVRWRQPGWGRASLLYADEHLICLSEDGTLRLVRASPDRCELVGELVLRNPLGSPLLKYPAWTAPVLSHGLLYVRGKDRLVCLRVVD